MAKDTGVVNIHGKQYTTVAKRVQDFREKYSVEKLAIVTELVERTDSDVVMKATIQTLEGQVIATGYAEEQRSASQINRTSALENCETSAIGRALAAFGLAGSEYASADEVAQAISQQGSDSRPSYSSDKPASDKQKAFITKLLNERGIANEDMPGHLIENYGVDNPKAMTAEQASFVIDELTGDN